MALTTLPCATALACDLLGIVESFTQHIILVPARQMSTAVIYVGRATPSFNGKH
jgi:hypothetical protein